MHLGLSNAMISFKKKTDADFSELAKVFGINAKMLQDEWKYARRAPEGVELSVMASCPRVRTINFRHCLN